MNMTVSIGTPGAPGSITYTPMEYIFKIKNPEMMENEYTVRDDRAAREIMQNLGVLDFDRLEKLLDGLDFTAISTRQLSHLSSELLELGLNDEFAAVYLAAGNMDEGFDGRQRNLDVKFNAIPLINERLDSQIEFGRSEGLTHDRAYGRILGSYTNANHIVAALSYLAKSAQKLPSINERV